MHEISLNQYKSTVLIDLPIRLNPPLPLPSPSHPCHVTDGYRLRRLQTPSHEPVDGICMPDDHIA